MFFDSLPFFLASLHKGPWTIIQGYVLPFLLVCLLKLDKETSKVGERERERGRKGGRIGIIQREVF